MAGCDGEWGGGRAAAHRGGAARIDCRPRRLELRGLHVRQGHFLAALILSLERDVYAVTADACDPRSFHVHALRAPDAKKKRQDAQHTFQSVSAVEAAAWIDAIQHALAGVAPGGLACTRHPSRDGSQRRCRHHITCWC